MSNDFRKHCSTIALLLLVMNACARQQVQPTREPANNPMLTELFREDQLSQTGGTEARSNEDRIKLVLSELANGRVVTSDDELHAALVLDHSPMTFRNGDLIAISPDNYLLGHYLASRAFERGNQSARQLVAFTIDRYLTMTEGYQKYGSNRLINQQTGQEELSPVDRTVPDSERAKYGIAPLAELLKRYPERARKKP